MMVEALVMFFFLTLGKLVFLESHKYLSTSSKESQLSDAKTGIEE
jgi:hypothetical protein